MYVSCPATIRPIFPDLDEPLHLREGLDVIVHAAIVTYLDAKTLEQLGKIPNRQLALGMRDTNDLTGGSSTGVNVNFQNTRKVSDALTCPW